MGWILLVMMIAMSFLAHRSEQAMSRAKTFSVNGNIVGVDNGNTLWIRKDVDTTHSWMKMEGSCCVKQIHVLKTGAIIGVGLDKYDIPLISYR